MFSMNKMLLVEGELVSQAHWTCVDHRGRFISAKITVFQGTALSKEVEALLEYFMHVMEGEHNDTL
jgi:hypothetical protein